MVAGARADREAAPSVLVIHSKPCVTGGAAVVMERETLLGVTSTGEEEKALHRAQSRLFTETVFSSHIKAATTLH